MNADKAEHEAAAPAQYGRIRGDEPAPAAALVPLLVYLSDTWAAARWLEGRHEPRHEIQARRHIRQAAEHGRRRQLTFEHGGELPNWTTYRDGESDDLVRRAGRDTVRELQVNVGADPATATMTLVLKAEGDWRATVRIRAAKPHVETIPTLERQSENGRVATGTNPETGGMLELLAEHAAEHADVSSRLSSPHEDREGRLDTPTSARPR